MAAAGKKAFAVVLPAEEFAGDYADNLEADLQQVEMDVGLVATVELP